MKTTGRGGAEGRRVCFRLPVSLLRACACGKPPSLSQTRAFTSPSRDVMTIVSVVPHVHSRSARVTLDASFPPFSLFRCFRLRALLGRPRRNPDLLRPIPLQLQLLAGRALRHLQQPLACGLPRKNDRDGCSCRLPACCDRKQHMRAHHL